MVLGRITATTLEFFRRGRLRAPLLTALAFAVLALLPLLTPGVPGGHPLATAALLGALSVSLFWYSVRRAERLIVDLEARRIHTRRGDLSLDAARELALTTTTELDEAPRRRYRVVLVLATGDRIRLLEGSDPARVLRDLRQVVTKLDLPVRSGWQLPAGATPWLASPTAPHSAPTAQAFVAEARPHVSQGRTAVTVLSGAVVTAVAMGIMLVSRVRRGAPLSTLSLALTLGTVALLLVLALLLTGLRTRVRWAQGVLHIESGVFRTTWRRTRVEAAQLCGIYAISPTPGAVEHILLDTGDAIVAVPCAGGGGEAVREALLPLLDQSETRKVPGTQLRS